jgi:hypothetical protein
MGVKVSVMVPSSVQELVGEFGEDNVWKAICRYICYQKWNPKFRQSLVVKLAETTGIAMRPLLKKNSEGELVPQTKKNRKGEVETVLETEQSYINFLFSEESGANLDEGTYAMIAQQVADSIPVELSIDDDEDTIDQDFYVLARKKLAAIEAGQTTLEAFVANFEALNPSTTFDSLAGEAEVDKLARAYFINDRRVRAAQAAAL